MSAPASLTPAQAEFLKTPGLQEIFALIEAAGGEARVNGGAVRNALLGEPVSDIDLSTTLLPEEAAACLTRGGVRVIPTGMEHGTITAVVNGRGFEITTLREDIETDGRRAIVRFGKSWLADAMRRDFTMNALYCDSGGRLYDPVGGYDDILSRTVRFIGDPDKRLLEDRLRILRFFRFHAWYGASQPDEQSLQACIRHKHGLSRLSAERIWTELKKLLAAPDPVESIRMMRDHGILAIILAGSEKSDASLFPALVESATLAGEKPDPLLRLMALLPPQPDIGDLARRLRLSNEEAQRLQQASEAPLPTAENLQALLYRKGVQPILDALMLERGRLHAAGRSSSLVQALIEEARQWSRPQFPLSGRDLIEAGCKPGPQMGKTLDRLEEEWIASGFRMDRQELLERAISDSTGGDEK